MLIILAEIIVSVFAVIGFYGAVKSVGYRLFGVGGAALSVLVENEEDAELIEERLFEVLGGYLNLKGARILILVTDRFADDQRIKVASRRYGAERYIIKRED